MRWLSLVVIFGAFFLANGLQQNLVFNANVMMSNMVGVDGSFTGQMSYDATLRVIKTAYTVGPVEYFNFTSKLRYLICDPLCDTETWGKAMPIFYAETTDIVNANHTVNGCVERTKASFTSGITKIYVDATGSICRAVWTDGSIYDFTSVSNTATPLSSFVPPTTCPQPLCSKKIDFEMAFDESGSISGVDFKTMKTFAGNIAKAYTWGVEYVAMGVTFFGTVARLVVPITFSQASFLQQLGLAYQNGGSTCIACGIKTAWADIVAHGRFQPDGVTPVTRVFMVLTDGADNSAVDFRPPLNIAKNAGAIFFCIGVGDYVTADVEEIASDIAGVNTTFYGNSFSALPSILDGLIVATCVDIPGNQCGTGCKGFCACSGNCMCPDYCEDGNFCTQDQCTIGIGGNGCIHPGLTCDDDNFCTDDTCVTSIGCIYTNVTCNDGDLCTFDYCDTNIGCIYPVNDCNDGSPCTTDTCTPGNGTGAGCHNIEVPNCNQTCNDPTRNHNCSYIPCMINECNPLLNGTCTARNRTCVDANPCTINGCNITTDACTFTLMDCNDHNACTIDYCNTTNGQCMHNYIDVPTVCNDYNACTLDLCDAKIGCYNKNRTCSDNDTCTHDMCNSLTGCYYPQVDCWTFDPQLVAHPDLVGCYGAYCASGTNPNPCKLVPLNGTGVDKCGVCNGDNSSCNLALGSSQTIGIGAAVIASIVVGSILICAVLGVLGGKKGYDVWLKHRTNMQGANTNPLYTSEGLSGVNPMYSGDEAIE